MLHTRIYAIVSLIIASSSLCSVAHGETEKQLATAKALFDDAMRLMDEGKYDSACGLFEQSLATGRGLGTKFHLADCEEHRENFSKAQALFLEVAEAAREAGQADRERLARERATAIDEKLVHLKVEQDVPAVEIALDGQPLNAAATHDFFSVAQGKHRITASASGKKTWTKDIEVPKAGMFVIVTVPHLESADRAPAPATAAVVAAPPPPPSAPSQSEGTTPDSTPKQGAVARQTTLILGGIGLGATVVGVAFGVQYLVDNHDAKKVCPTGNGCSDTDIAQHASFVSDAHSARTWSYLGLGLGAAALSGAAILYFNSPHSGALSAATGFGPDGSWNVAVRGGF